MDCTSPIDSIACLTTTASIILPLVVVSWLVGMMLAAAMLRANRRALVWAGAIAFPLGFASVLLVTIIFAELELGGLWELIVGPAIVFGESVGLARIAALRAEQRAAER